MARRKVTVDRQTGETRIKVELQVDGTGKNSIKTGVSMLDHLLSQVASHGRFDLKVGATGDLVFSLNNVLLSCLMGG